MADANRLKLRFHSDYLRTDRGSGFWDPVIVQMKAKFEPIWLDAINNAYGTPDLSMRGSLDEEVEDLGYKLLLVGPLVDSYLKNLANGVKRRLRKSHTTGLMNDFSFFVPLDVIKYMIVMWRNYGGQSVTDRKKMTFTAKSKSTLEKFLAPSRFDDSCCLRKKHFHKVRQPRAPGRKRGRVEYVPNGHSTVVISENTPFCMQYNVRSGFLSVSFYRQNYNIYGIAEDTTLQAVLNIL